MTDEQILALVPEHFKAELDGDVVDMDGVMSLYAWRFTDFARAVRKLALEEAAQPGLVNALRQARLFIYDHGRESEIAPIINVIESALAAATRDGSSEDKHE